MLGLRRPDEYEIAVCGYTSDLGGKNLQSEWYAIKVLNPDPDPDPDPYMDPDPYPYQYSDDLSMEIYPSIAKSSIEKIKINPSIAQSSIENIEISRSSAKRKIALSSSTKEKEKVKINPPSAKANEKGTIESEPLHPFPSAKEKEEVKMLHPFSVRMMHQSTQHAVVGFAPWCRLYSFGGLDPVGSDSDGDGAHPFESERYRKVWSLDVNKPDAGWKAVPLMTFPNRYNPQLVSLRPGGSLYVLGGFSRSQFPAEAAEKRVGWMEVYFYHPIHKYIWKPLPNPPSGFSFNDDPLIFTALNDKMKILLAQYNHDDMNCDSATFYVYDATTGCWTTLDPPVRKLLARYPDRTGRRSVAVGNTLYWGSFEDEDINVQAYDLDKNIWFHGSFNIRPVLEKDEFLADNGFTASPPLLHLANQKFCLFLLTSIYDEKNCEVSNLYLNCLILNVSPINAPDNHQHDYYDHVCYKVHGDVSVDDKEDNANYHVHPHNHFWRLSISIASIQKYPLVNPIQLWDAAVLKYSKSRSMARLKSY